MFKKLKEFKEFRNKKATEAPTERNPWLDIPHEHDWLPANEGKELVCGLCGERRDVL